MVPTPPEVILAVLEEARRQSRTPLLKTVLIKLLYLLDVYTAEECGGRPLSGWEWRFLHFGPYSTAAVQTIDSLVAKRLINAQEKESASGDKEFVLYDLADYRSTRNLRDLGIAGAIQLRIQADIQRYSRDLQSLLNYVYFQTEPMRAAAPGSVLDFSTCRKADSTDFRPVTMLPLRPKAVKKVRERLRALIQARKVGYQAIAEGPYDEIYFRALAELEGEPLETGIKGTAELKVD